MVSVEADVCKTLEVKQKGVKLVDASGMAVRLRCLWKVLGTKAAG